MVRTACKNRMGLAHSAVTVLIAAVIILSSSCSERQNIFVLTGGYLIDTSFPGLSGGDRENTAVMVRNGIIESVADAESFAEGHGLRHTLPPDAEVIDISGRYIVPGLIDGFAAINNQSYANAYLYMGVTSIIAVSGGRRGDLFLDADPGPSVFRLESTGSEQLSTASMLEEIDRYADEGVKALLLMYQIRPDQLKALVERAHMHDMATIGELGRTTYEQGIESGVKAFVHTTRYSLNAAPPEMQRRVADNPFSDDLDSDKWQYYSWLSSLIPDDDSILHHARVLTSGSTYLIPTLSLLYLDQQWSANPWNEPVAQILDPAGINNPANRETGKHDYSPEQLAAYSALAERVIQIERANNEAGARYLAGSGTDVWGTMPGISLHTELEGLMRAGLSARKSLSAATSNFSDAFGWNVGKIEEGYCADILVLDGNPLEDITNLTKISLLMKDGMIIDRESLVKKR
ncbi:amidohydrolase family protein [candidate division KSB1 bacterium]